MNNLDDTYNKNLERALKKLNLKITEGNANQIINSIQNNPSKSKISHSLLSSFGEISLIGKSENIDVFLNKYKILNSIPNGEFLSKFKETNFNLKTDEYLFNKLNYLETWLINLEAWIINIFVQDNLSKFKKLAQDNGININNISSYKDIDAIRDAYKKLALKLHPDKNGGTDSSNSQFTEFHKLAKSIEEGEIHSNSSIYGFSSKLIKYVNYLYLIDSGLKITNKVLSLDKGNILGKNTLLLVMESINLFLMYSTTPYSSYLITNNISKIIVENWEEGEGTNYGGVFKDLSITAGIAAATSKVAKFTMAISTLNIPFLSYSIYYNACSVFNKILKLTEEYAASWNTYIWGYKVNSKATKKPAEFKKPGPITVEIDTNKIIDAISKGNQKTVDNFITQTRDVNIVMGENGYSYLAYAVHYKNKKMVKFLIDKGANVNARDKSKKTPLYSAIEKKYNEIAKYLIKKGADINAKNADGYTPSITAAGSNNEELLKELIAKKADINIQDNMKQTALTYAAYKGYIWAVKELIKAGANCNLRDHQGDTALTIALGNNHLEIAKTLIEVGVDISIKDAKGSNALMIAKQKGYKEIASLLREKGADDVGAFYLENNVLAVLRDFRGGEEDHENLYNEHHKKASELSIYNDDNNATEM